jgi:hypothetical protein
MCAGKTTQGKWDPAWNRINSNNYLHRMSPWMSRSRLRMIGKTMQHTRCKWRLLGFNNQIRLFYSRLDLTDSWTFCRLIKIQLKNNWSTDNSQSWPTLRLNRLYFCYPSSISPNQCKLSTLVKSECSCLLCPNPMRNRHLCRMLPCYHSFHMECIDLWFSKNTYVMNLNNHWIKGMPAVHSVLPASGRGASGQKYSENYRCRQLSLLLRQPQALQLLQW